MKKINMHKMLMIALFYCGCISANNNVQAADDNIASRPASNLFDSKTSTSWISSFCGETFPIDLEINFGTEERLWQVMLQQTTETALDACKVVDFEIYFKSAATDSYPATPAFTGSMADVSTKQTFTLPDTISANYMLISIKSVKGSESTTAALSEVGYRSLKSNGLTLSSYYDPNQPFIWPGVTWSSTQPYQVTGISWTNKSTMTGEFTPNLFALLGNNYTFTGTGITIANSTGVVDTKTDVSLSVYPNPVSDKLYINSSSAVKSVKAVSLFGISIPLNVNDGTVDVSALQSGTYAIVVETENGFSTAKIIKK